MLFLTTAVMGVVMLLAPLYTSNLYRNAVVWERLQIGMDNAAIALGKRDRDLLKFIQNQNKILSGLEVEHHIAHACAKAPPTAAECLPIDQAIEASIRNVAQFTRTAATAWWTKNWLAAKTEILSVQSDIRIDRAASIAMTGNRCAVCGEVTEFRLEERRLTSRFTGDRVRWMTIEVKPVKTQEGWNYALKE